MIRSIVTMLITGALVYSIIMGFVAYYIAKPKRNTSFWWGFFLGVIGIIVVILLNNNNNINQISNSQKEE